MSSHRLFRVILVTSTTSSLRNSWKKLMTNSNTRRLSTGSRSTKARHDSALFDATKASLYKSSGMTGSRKSRSQSLNSEAPTCGSPIPV